MATSKIDIEGKMEILKDEIKKLKLTIAFNSLSHFGEISYSQALQGTFNSFLTSLIYTMRPLVI